MAENVLEYNLMNFIKSIFLRHRGHAPLLAGLLLIAPVFFFQGFRYSIPLGYAGMFTQMAEQIANGNFSLPMEIPHYGPGGIPFVYPPLAMYLFAVAIKLGLSIWAYLRLVPAVFSLLAFIPFYYLTRELTGSKIAASVAMILAATAPTIYHTHVWSAGIVRGLALGLCFAGLLFYLRAIRQFSRRDIVLSGIFLGLLLMTHLLYVAFAALVGISFLFSEWKPRRVLTSLGILLLALLIASPWLGVIVARHGLQSLMAASSSHRNTDFFAMLFQDAGAALGFLADNLSHVTDNWFLAALALPGLILLLAQRKFQLPLAFILALVMGEASIFLPILAGMIAGAFSAQIFTWAAERVEKKRTALALITYASLLIVVVSASLLSAATGLVTISRYEPEIDVYSLKMAKFVQEETSLDKTYLYIGKINEAEWFPYLLDRTPVFALWGSEWKGIYAEQLQILVDLRDCQVQKDWACMESLQQTQNVSPGLLIGPNQRWLVLQIKETRQWDVIYADERYLVWERRK